MMGPAGCTLPVWNDVELSDLLAACELQGVEGLVAKRLRSRYRPGRRRPEGGRRREARGRDVRLWEVCAVVRGLMVRFFRRPPTGLADGFGREVGPTGRGGARGRIHPRTAVGPRLAPSGDSAASGTGPPAGGAIGRPDRANVSVVIPP